MKTVGPGGTGRGPPPRTFAPRVQGGAGFVAKGEFLRLVGVFWGAIPAKPPPSGLGKRGTGTPFPGGANRGVWTGMGSAGLGRLVDRAPGGGTGRAPGLQAKTEWVVPWAGGGWALSVPKIRPLCPGFGCIGFEGLEPGDRFRGKNRFPNFFRDLHASVWHGARADDGKGPASLQFFSASFSVAGGLALGRGGATAGGPHVGGPSSIEGGAPGGETSRNRRGKLAWGPGDRGGRFVVGPGMAPWAIPKGNRGGVIAKPGGGGEVFWKGAQTAGHTHGPRGLVRGPGFCRFRSEGGGPGGGFQAWAKGFGAKRPFYTRNILV